MNATDVLLPALSGVANQFEVDTPEFDEAGFAVVGLDDEYPIHLQIRGHIQELKLFVVLGEIEKKYRSDIMMYALSANLKQEHTCGAVISFEPNSENLVLHQTIPVSLVDTEGLIDQCKALKRATEIWRAILSEAKKAAGFLKSGPPLKEIASILIGDMVNPAVLA